MKKSGKLIRLRYLMFLFIATPVIAGTPLEAVRKALDSGDVSQIESLTYEFSSQTEAAAIADYREVARILFKTTHPERRETIARWAKAHPKSVRAQTALVWMTIHDVDVRTRISFGNPIEPKDAINLEKLSKFKKKAKHLANTAVAMDATHVSAIDAWLYTRRWDEKKLFVNSMANALMEAAPDRDSVLNIMNATVSNILQVPRETGRICMSFADRAKDYDHSRCMVEHFLRLDAPGDVRDYAREDLKNHDDPRLDYARLLDRLIFSDPKNADFDEVAALHRGSLDREADIEWHRDLGLRLAHFTGRPDYRADMHVEMIKALSDWLEDDPYNPNYLRELLMSHHYNGTLQQNTHRGRRALVYGWNDQTIWTLNALMRFEGGTLAGLNEGADMLKNAIIVDSYSLNTIFVSHHHLHEAIAKVSKSYIITNKPICSKFRMARIADGLCQVHGAQAGALCDADKPLMAGVLETLQSDAPRQCTEVSAMPMSEIFYNVGPGQVEDAAREIANEVGH